MPSEDDSSEEDDHEFQQQQRIDQALRSLTSDELVQLLTEVEAELQTR